MSHAATAVAHPLAETARNLARRTNRRAIRWSVAGVVIVVGIVGIGAYGVQSSWVSNTIANSDTVANYQNQTLKNDASLLTGINAEALYTQTQGTYGDQWNALTSHITTTQNKQLASDQKAADQVAGKLIFPNLRADYRDWASERAESQPSVTAKQQAQLTALSVAQTACQDHYAGKPKTATMNTYASTFAPEKATGLEQALIALGLQQCGA